MIETDEQLDTERQDELGFLSCVAWGGKDAIVAAATTVPAEALRRKEHRLIYDAIVAVAMDDLFWSRGDVAGAVDMDAVAARLAERGELEQVGGHDAMGDLLFAAGSKGANLEYYMRRVKEAWALRRAADAAAQIRAAIDGSEPITERLAIVRRHAEELSHVGNGELSGTTKTFADFEAKIISWLWHEVLPAGMFVMLVSEEGVGKSTLAAWIAAMVTNGGQWPNGGRAHIGRVIWLSTEESPEYVLAPRLSPAVPTWGGSYRGLTTSSPRTSAGWTLFAQRTLMFAWWSWTLSPVTSPAMKIRISTLGMHLNP